MKEYEFEYSIYPDNSSSIFDETCEKIDRAFKDAEKQEKLVDVDGSTIQRFHIDGKKVVVYDDYDVGAVYVESDINLSGVVEEYDFTSEHSEEKQVKTA